MLDTLFLTTPAVRGKWWHRLACALSLSLTIATYVIVGNGIFSLHTTPVYVAVVAGDPQYAETTGITLRCEVITTKKGTGLQCPIATVEQYTGEQSLVPGSVVTAKISITSFALYLSTTVFFMVAVFGFFHYRVYGGLQPWLIKHYS